MTEQLTEQEKIEKVTNTMYKIYRDKTGGEPLRVEYINGIAYLFSSEIGCYRLLKQALITYNSTFREDGKDRRLDMDYSENEKNWFVSLQLNI